MAEIKGAISITDSGTDLLIGFNSESKRKSVNVNKGDVALVINNSLPNILYLNYVDGRSYVLDYTIITSPVTASAVALRDAISAFLDTSPATEQTGFVTTSLLESAATYTSPVINVASKSQVQTEVLASHDGTILIDFCSDADCTDIVRTITIPYIAANGYQFFSAPAFVNYIRYKFTNDGGVTQTDFYYTTKVLTTAISPQLLTTGAFIAPSMVSTLSRAIITGQESDGVFENVSVTETMNDSGVFHNLNVVSGARPSQLSGRVKVSEVVDTGISVLQRAVTPAKILYITDILLTIDNTDQNNSGRVNLIDGLTAVGPLILPLQIQESPTNESATVTISHTFAEPIEFTTGLFIEEAAGINYITGVMIGYEE